MPACLAEFLASPDGVGVTIIGFVSHAGLGVDEQVARAVAGVDFIVSAHTHTPMFPGLVSDCLAFANGTCQCAAAATTPSHPRYLCTLEILESLSFICCACCGATVCTKGTAKLHL